MNHLSVTHIFIMFIMFTFKKKNSHYIKLLDILLQLKAQYHIFMRKACEKNRFFLRIFTLFHNIESKLNESREVEALD